MQIRLNQFDNKWDKTGQSFPDMVDKPPGYSKSFFPNLFSRSHSYDLSGSQISTEAPNNIKRVANKLISKILNSVFQKVNHKTSLGTSDRNVPKQGEDRLQNVYEVPNSQLYIKLDKIPPPPNRSLPPLPTMESIRSSEDQDPIYEDLDSIYENLEDKSSTIGSNELFSKSPLSKASEDIENYESLSIYASLYSIYASVY